MKTPVVETNVLLTLVVVLNIFALLFYYLFFLEQNYLPAPFLFDKSNSFMDFFNTLYWAEEGQYYTEWKSIYPPLVFGILKIIYSIFELSSNVHPEDMRDRVSNFYYISVVVYLYLGYAVVSWNYWGALSFKEKFFYIRFNCQE
jgi:hypothetical protein